VFKHESADKADGYSAGDFVMSYWRQMDKKMSIGGAMRFNWETKNTFLEACLA
jgi:hypothetical protein